MLALDLFNTKYEQDLREGAVDDLEARRIDTLNVRMQDLLARAKEPAYQANPAALAGLKKQFQQVKDERDSYFKIKEELSGDELNRRMAQLGKDASAGITQSINRQSDARIAALKNPPKEKSFMQQVGDKQIGMVKGAWKGLTGGVEETGIPGNVPTEKIPGKEDLLKGKGRSYYEDQKKNSDQVTEYISMGSDKNYQEAEPYKNYRIYVRKKPFGNTGMYTAHTEIDRKEFMGKGPSPEEAIQAVQDRIDFVLNAQKKVTGSSTIDFNVKFATDLLADPKQTFYAKLENINGKPKLVIAGPDIASDPELLAAGDFKRSALRNQVDDSGRATPLPGIPLTAKGLRSGEWIANGRYTVGRETSDRDGNRVFDLTYHSTAHTKSDKLRLNQPAFTLGTAREVDEEKKNTLNQRLDRLKIQARREFPQVDSDQEALLLKLLDKEAQDDRANRQVDARQDTELRKNFALDRDQEDEIENLQTQVGVKEHGGGIGPRQRWQDLMPEQSNPEDDDWYDDEDLRLRSGDYVRDTMDGESGEVFRMQGDPEERRVRILDRDGKGWYIEPSRLTRVDATDPEIQRYFGKKRIRDMDESGVEEGWYDPKSFPGAKLGPHIAGPAPTPVPQVKDQIIKSLMIAHKDLFDKYGQRDVNIVAQSEAAKTEPTPQGIRKAVNNVINFLVSGSSVSRLRQQTLEDNVDEGWSDAIVARRTGRPRTPYSVYIKGRKWKDFENEDLAQAVMNRLKAKFKADGRDPETVTIAPTDMAEAKATKTRLDPKCWTGKKIGNPKTKVKGGVRVNNCVPAESIQEDQDTSDVERAILNRIMVAHTDLLMKFGPEKVMQAAEEVAYNVGDVDEIGTSDVSAYVHQVKQILGAVQQ
jgi:hypothetical protein